MACRPRPEPTRQHVRHAHRPLARLWVPSAVPTPKKMRKSNPKPRPAAGLFLCGRRQSTALPDQARYATAVESGPREEGESQPGA
jgi:hypothetical protein